MTYCVVLLIGVVRCRVSVLARSGTVDWSAG